jgi:plastocyanin
MTVRHALAAATLCGMVAAGAAFAQNVVSQKDKMFDPDEGTLPVGSSLHIDNDDQVTHNIQVRSPDGNNENLGVQKPGESVDLHFGNVGDYLVYCGIHPKMKLTVHVQ